MTNEEMERGIEFLLKHQADFEARVAQAEIRQTQTETQLTQTSKHVEVLAQTQAEFTKFVRGHLEAQSEINQSLREAVRTLTIAQARTDERLGDLEGSNGQG